MKRRLVSLLGAAIIVPLLGAATAVAVARADAPPDDDTLSPALATQTLPAERSALPTAEEWKSAVLVEPTRRSPLAGSCRVYLVREYVKVHCPFLLTGIRQHTGSSKDTQIWVTPKKIEPGGSGNFTDPPNGGQVVFPLVRGDGRMFQLFEMSFEGYGGFFSTPSVIVDAYWVDGRPAPTLVLR